MKIITKPKPVLLAERIKRREAMLGPRDGDFVRMPDGDLRRIAVSYWKEVHLAWRFKGDGPDPEGSYFLRHDGKLRQSGGRQERIRESMLTDTGEIVQGECWWCDDSGDGSAIDTTIPCRVYALASNEATE